MFWAGVSVRAALAVVAGGLASSSNEGSWTGNLASIPPPTMVTWLIDGNNLSCSRRVPNDRAVILRELSRMASPRADSSLRLDPDVISNVVVVFDGNEDEESDITIVEESKWLEWTVTDGRNRLKDRADDWIVNNTIPRLHEVIEQRISENKGSTKVNLVSADKELQKRVRATHILHGGSFIHPPRFWNDYLPVLQEQQEKLLVVEEQGM